MRKEFSPDARLGVCARYIRPGSRMADIGTDHALVPIYLVESGISPSAIAADLNEGPISRARANIAAHALGSSITTVVCDGLAGIDPDSVDDILIAGMGGELIAAILSRAEWVRNSRYRLVLQPMTRAHALREYLAQHGFEILDETAIDEGDHVYTAICTGYSGRSQSPSLSEIYAGGLLCKTDTASVKYRTKQARLLRSRAQGLRHSGDDTQANEYERAAAQLEAPLL